MSCEAVGNTVRRCPQSTLTSARVPRLARECLPPGAWRRAMSTSRVPPGTGLPLCQQNAPHRRAEFTPRALGPASDRFFVLAAASGYNRYAIIPPATAGPRPPARAPWPARGRR